VKAASWILSVLCLLPMELSAWTDGRTREHIRLRQLKGAVDLGQIMPNIPQMGRFLSAVGTALQIATDGQASAQEALREAAANMREK
jgi:maltose-binding protein MalE